MKFQNSLTKTNLFTTQYNNNNNNNSLFALKEERKILHETSVKNCKTHEHSYLK